MFVGTIQMKVNFILTILKYNIIFNDSIISNDIKLNGG